MRQRASLMFLGLVVCLAVVALGSAGIAGGAENSAQKCNVSDTGQDLGRDFCVDVKTFSGITASDPNAPQGTVGTRYTWVEFKLTNTGGTTLSNPRIVASLSDFCGAAQCASTTSQFVDFPANCTPNASKTSLTCTYANIPGRAADGYDPCVLQDGRRSRRRPRGSTSPAPSRSAATTPVAGLGDAPLPTRTATRSRRSSSTRTSRSRTTGVSFALNGKQIYLATNDKNSSFAFKSGHATPFRADFTTTFPAECVAPVSPTCFYRIAERDAHVRRLPRRLQRRARRLLRARSADLPQASPTRASTRSTRTTTFTVAAEVIGDDPSERSDNKKKKAARSRARPPSRSRASAQRTSRGAQDDRRLGLGQRQRSDQVDVI